LDDIERKHSALNIEEVMGFIDEFTQIYGSRIVLILNSDQLQDKAMWDRLREKVIDHEIALNTTPGEAFEIAIKAEPSAYQAHIRGAVEVSKISNIRIIKKIIRSVNRLLGDRTDLVDEVLKRIVPSTVLMCGIHYRGLEDGPSSEFVLRFNGIVRAMEKREQSPDTEDGGDDKESRWAELLGALNINSCDEYEHMVQRFLASGIRVEAEVREILDRYVSEKDTFAANQRVRHFHELQMWHPLKAEEELLDEARSLVAVAHRLDGYTVSALVDAICELSGGQPIADALITNWLRAFNAVERTQFHFDETFDRPLHPQVKAAFVALEARLYPKPSLVDACLRIASNEFGSAERAALLDATPETYRLAIKSLAGPDLRAFLRENIKLYVRRSQYESEFGGAMEHFATACRTICIENEMPRLRRLLRLTFDHMNVGAALDDQDSPRPSEIAGGRGSAWAAD
jgi:hypothetical protein